jgi:hypothetical protein
VVGQLQALVDQSGSTLGRRCGLSTRSVAELLVEVGDPRRFTGGGLARFNGSAPLTAGVDLRCSSAVELLRESIPLPPIQRQLGHSHLSTTGTYLLTSAPVDGDG